MSKKDIHHEFTANGSSIIFTPKPTASSTIEKKHFSKYFEAIDKVSPEESLGILSLDDVDLTPELENPRTKQNAIDDTYSRLRQQRLLAHDTLNKAKTELPSRFFAPSESYEHVTPTYNRLPSESTVNETDLLKSAKTPFKPRDSSCFNPNDVSTPRHSQVARVDSHSLYEDMTRISEKIRYSDISLKDLCSQFSKIDVESDQTEKSISGIDSRMFEPAEEQRLIADELSWRKKYGMPVANDNFKNSMFSTCVNSTTNEVSVGDFFKQKSEEIFDPNFFKTSPEKHDPVPLIDCTNTMSQIYNEANNSCKSSITSADLQGNSILSVSHIQRILSSANSQDSPTNVINCLLKKDCKTISSEIFEKQGQDNKVSNSTDISQIYEKSSEEYGSDSSTEKQTDVPKIRRREKMSAHQDKENFLQSVNSTRTASSLSSLPEGKYPIKSTHTELVWGCVKLHRNNTQEFSIRNQLNQKIRMQASVTGTCFRILKERVDSDAFASLTFVLHAMETKSFYVSFCPTTIGGFAEKLQFFPIVNGEIQHNKKQMLRLYGYGGHINLDFLNITKDSNGKFWLSLGKLQNKSAVTQNFFIKNNGTLDAFVCIDVQSKGLYAFSVLYVKPKKFILKPQEQIVITITFTPVKKDFLRSVASEVIELGYLKLMYGAESLRGRLHRLCTKLKQKGETPDPALEKLSIGFVNENVTSDLKLFQESVAVTKDLLQQVLIKEIILTMEQDLENTLIGHIDIDETSMYQTLCPNNSDFSIAGNETVRERSEYHLKVEPSIILLNPPAKVQDIILIHSKNVNPINFEAAVEPSAIFQVSPKSGTIPSEGSVILKVSCLSSKAIEKNVGKVSVFVDNDVIEVIVKCVFIK